MRILVVEDDLDTLEYYERLLVSAGYAVTLAPDGLIGMARAMDTPLDGVILDYRLPDTSGMEVCRWLRAHLALTVPILVLTADRTPTIRDEAMMAGATAFLAKPFDVAELFALLTAHGVPATK